MHRAARARGAREGDVDPGIAIAGPAARPAGVYKYETCGIVPPYRVLIIKSIEEDALSAVKGKLRSLGALLGEERIAAHQITEPGRARMQQHRRATDITGRQPQGGASLVWIKRNVGRIRTFPVPESGEVVRYSTHVCGKRYFFDGERHELTPLRLRP